MKYAIALIFRAMSYTLIYQSVGLKPLIGIWLLEWAMNLDK